MKECANRSEEKEVPHEEHKNEILVGSTGGEHADGNINYEHAAGGGSHWGAASLDRVAFRVGLPAGGVCIVCGKGGGRLVHMVDRAIGGHARSPPESVPTSDV